MPSIARDFTAAARGPSVCVSVTLMHPTEAVERNEMPFDRDTHVVVGNIVLRRGSGPPHGKERFWGRNPRPV